ncbi:hypothetical protein SVIOM74S_03442 [Streptomyces violarus]
MGLKERSADDSASPPSSPSCPITRPPRRHTLTPTMTCTWQPRTSCSRVAMPYCSAIHWYRRLTPTAGLTGSGDVASAATVQPISPACRAASLRQRTISARRLSMDDCGWVANSSICSWSSFSKTS